MYQVINDPAWMGFFAGQQDQELFRPRSLLNDHHSNIEKAKQTGKPLNEVAFDAEISQGQNIVRAAQATIETLEVLVLSVLTDSRKWSNGKITWNYHFEGKWRIAEYLQENHPELNKKTSLFQPAFFMTNLESQMAPHQVSPLKLLWV